MIHCQSFGEDIIKRLCNQHKLFHNIQGEESKWSHLYFSKLNKTQLKYILSRLKEISVSPSRASLLSPLLHSPQSKEEVHWDQLSGKEDWYPSVSCCCPSPLASCCIEHWPHLAAQQCLPLLLWNLMTLSSPWRPRGSLNKGTPAGSVLHPFYELHRISLMTCAIIYLVVHLMVNI